MKTAEITRTKIASAGVKPPSTSVGLVDAYALDLELTSVLIRAAGSSSATCTRRRVSLVSTRESTPSLFVNAPTGDLGAFPLV